MASIIIRDALLSDIDICQQIERNAAKRFLQSDDAQIRAVVKNSPILDIETLAKSVEHELCFISEISQEAVGFIALKQFEQSWYIEELSVVEHAQSRGVGSGLLAYIKMLAEIRRIASINLITFKDVAWNMPFYASKGYKQMLTERLSTQFLNLWHEDNAVFDADLRICMQLKIDIDKF
ncbi:MAG: GNAT family N-acetyltransferase [Rhizobiales bacterium]|nr:GNAT family N-acetyltransferase [Hyphomicrobiales bacterium]